MTDFRLKRFTDAFQKILKRHGDVEVRFNGSGDQCWDVPLMEIEDYERIMKAPPGSIKVIYLK